MCIFSTLKNVEPSTSIKQMQTDRPTLDSHGLEKNPISPLPDKNSENLKVTFLALI